MVKAISSANITSNYNTRSCSGCKKPAFGQENPSKKRLKKLGSNFVYGAVVSGIFDAVRAGYNFVTKAPQQSLKSIGSNAVILGLGFMAIDSVMSMYYKHKAKKIFEEQQKRPI